jgi:hypothetical protein
MKIIATVTNTGHYACAGGKAENTSGMIDVPDDDLPKVVKDYLQHRSWAERNPGNYTYETISFSLLIED